MKCPRCHMQMTAGERHSPNCADIFSRSPGPSLYEVAHGKPLSKSVRASTRRKWAPVDFFWFAAEIIQAEWKGYNFTCPFCDAPAYVAPFLSKRGTPVINGKHRPNCVVTQARKMLE